MAPRAEDLFLNIWSASLHDEDGMAQPGMEEWDSNVIKIHKHWARVWEHCSALTSYIEAREQAKENVLELFQELKAEAE